MMHPGGNAVVILLVASSYRNQVKPSTAVGLKACGDYLYCLIHGIICIYCDWTLTDVITLGFLTVTSKILSADF